MKMINILNVLNFEYIIVGVIVAIIYMIWSLGIKPSKRKKEIKLLLEEIVGSYNYKVSSRSEKGSKYDFVLDSTGDSKYKQILIKTIEVPKVNTITINSKNTWNLHYGGTAEPGRGFPYNRFLDELKPFLNIKVEDDVLKLVIVYKSTLKIQRYLNESELQILKYSDKVYDYKIITFGDLKAHFEDL